MHLLILIFWTPRPNDFSYLVESPRYLFRKWFLNQKVFCNLKIKIKSHLSDFGALGTLKPFLFVGDTVVCHPDFPWEKGLLSQLLAVLLAGNRQLSAPLWLPQLQRAIWPNINPLLDDPHSTTNQYKGKKTHPSWPNLEQLWRAFLVSELCVGSVIAVVGSNFYLKLSLFLSLAPFPYCPKGAP